MPSPSPEVIRRRRVVAVAALGAVLLVVGVVIASALGGGGSTSQKSKAGASSATSSTDSTSTTSAALAENPQKITALMPGTAKVITEAQGNPRQVALTFDDGFCVACVKKIVDTLESSGAHATFFPNGQYASSWDPQAGRIKKMVASGQLTLGNHTFSHQASTQIGAEAFGQDLQRNEDWIQKTFGLTGRPWFRPPYGDYNSGTVAKAGELGYTNVVMWSGTVADSSVRTPKYILNAIKYWAKPGRIILMHGNYPATAQVLPKILTMLKGMNLQPVTMAELAKNGTRSNSPSTGY